MTSSDLPRNAASNTHQTRSTLPSVATSKPSSTREALDRSKLVASQTERNLVQSALSYLGAVEGPSPTSLSFTEFLCHEEKNGLVYLGKILGASRYIPFDTSRQLVSTAVEQLRGEALDSGTIRAHLFELWLTTKHEKMSPDDRDAMLMLYVKRLADFPRHAAVTVLMTLSQTCKFWPAWSEVQEQLDAILNDRATLIHALRLVIPKLKED